MRIQVRAVRRAGQLLSGMEKAKGKAGRGAPGPGRGKTGLQVNTPFSGQTLSDLGISKNQSSKSTSLAEMAKNTEAERRACEIRLRAERRAGQLLSEMEKSAGARGNPNGRGAPIVRSRDETTQTLADLGISKNQSSKWQQLARVPDQQFEAAPATKSLVSGFLEIGC